MKKNDEYIWENYTPEYKAQLEEIARDDKQDFFITDFNFDKDDNLTFINNLHPNWKELYHNAFRLYPKSIFECGCGAGYHLKNIKVISEAEISGCDLLESQLNLAKEFSGISGMQVLDLTNPVQIDKQYEFVYSQAVVMHLSTENALAFLANMKNISSKYVLLIEGVKNHENWYDMVKGVFEGWDFELTSKHIDYGVLLTKK